MIRLAVVVLVLTLLAPAYGAPASPASPFGSHLSPDDALLEMGREAGIAWTRTHDTWIPFYWAPTEPEPGRWVWHDDEVARVRAHGYQILGMLGMPPEWAAVKVPPEERPSGYIAQWQTRDLAAWEDYVFQTVSHYRGQVRHWEVWNEPNCDGFFAPRDDPALYIVLLEHAYAAAKRANPDCVILAPSIASIDLEWIELVLRLGILRHCDAFSLHAYLLPPGRDLVAQLEALKALLRLYRCDKPIWVTEVGWDVGADKADDPEAQSWKANNHVRLTVICIAHGIERVFSYPFGGERWGFVADDPPRPLPLFHAYRTMTHVLEGAQPAAILSETHLLWAYLFERGGTGIAVLWSEGDTRVELPVGVPQVRLLDRDGSERTLRARDGWLSLDLGSNPVYLVGVKAERMRALTQVAVEPDYHRAVAGSRMRAAVEVRNPGREPLAVTVRPVGLEAWKVKPAVIGGRLAPGERRAFAFDLRVPDVQALPASVETVLHADDRPTPLTARRAPLDFDVEVGDQRLGRVRVTADVSPDYGFIRDWLVVGPFDASDRKGLERAYGPEENASFGRIYPTWDGLRPWRPLHTDDVLGIVDLGGFFDREDAVCGFALCYLHSPVAREVQLRLGRNDEMAVFLGGKEIWRAEGGRRLVPDDAIVPITLPAGTTPLLLKVSNWGGKWGFAARLTDAGGSPLGGVRVTLTPQR